MKTKDFKRFQFLSDFAERKIITVRIVDAINHSQFVSVKISVMAVNQELLNLSKCMNVFGIDKRENILKEFNKFNKNSIDIYTLKLYINLFSKTMFNLDY